MTDIIFQITVRVHFHSKFLSKKIIVRCFLVQIMDTYIFFPKYNAFLFTNIRNSLNSYTCIKT